MTRKDYELIARVLSNFVGDGGDVIDRDALAYDLADALGADSPRFDRERFLIAAGVFSKCDKCAKRARFFTSRAAYCSLPHAPAWAKRVTEEAARTAQESINVGIAFSKSLGY